MDEEALIVWQDVLDEINAGRSGALTCPKCGHTPLDVSRTPEGFSRIACSACGEFIEGRFGAQSPRRIRDHMSRLQDFLGRGWRFPVAISRTGGIATSAAAENIRESIFVILGTAPGERIQRPKFGCDIHELVFAPNNPTTAAIAEHYCEEALLLWEPRIKNVDVNARPTPGEPNRLDIRITYVVRGSNRPGNLVYPFYLRAPEET